jgi:hypothetical protein
MIHRTLAGGASVKRDLGPNGARAFPDRGSGCSEITGFSSGEKPVVKCRVCTSGQAARREGFPNRAGARHMAFAFRPLGTCMLPNDFPRYSRQRREQVQ